MNLKALALQVLDSKPIRKQAVNIGDKIRKLDTLKKVSSENEPFKRPSLNDLKTSGWTDQDLYRKYLPIGLLNLPIWNDPTVTVKLEGNVLSFTWINRAGKQITQTCRPEPRWQNTATSN